MRRDVFQAIADPTRRNILSIIALSEHNLNSVAETFKISRQAVSKHIKILSECGLIEIESRGREHICIARLEKLAEVSSWVEQYKSFWTERFDAIDNLLNELQFKGSDNKGSFKLKEKKSKKKKNGNSKGS